MGAQEIKLGKAGIEALIRIAYVVLRTLNVACLTEILQVKCVGGLRLMTDDRGPKMGFSPARE